MCEDDILSYPIQLELRFPTFRSGAQGATNILFPTCWDVWETGKLTVAGTSKKVCQISTIIKL